MEEAGTLRYQQAYDTVNDRAYFIAVQSGSQMWFGTANVERMRIDSSGKVGIGTTAPDRLLHLYAGASGQATPTTSAMLVLEDDASGNYISFLNPNNATAGFFWGDPQDSARAQLIYSR